MNLIVVYIVVFLFTFFAGSFMVSLNKDNPTNPHTFLMLVGASLVWPITVPLTVSILILLVIAKLAITLSGGGK